MFSKRLSCFYCGHRSAQADKNVRKWRCRHCEAVNYLDEVCACFRFPFAFSIFQVNADAVSRTERLPTHPPLKRILMFTVLGRQTFPLSRLILQDPASSVLSVFATSICSPVHLPPISHRQRTPIIAHTSENIPVFEGTWRNDIHKSVQTANLGCRNVLGKLDMRRNQTTFDG